MKIAVACDHGGYPVKDLVKEILKSHGCEVADLGVDEEISVDYPDFAFQAINELVFKRCDRIVLSCGTGIGMSICANRIPGIRGTLCHDSYPARMSRQHNDSNCLIIGARVVGPAVAEEIVEVWLQTPFEGGRHQARLDKIDELAAKV